MQGSRPPRAATSARQPPCTNCATTYEASTTASGTAPAGRGCSTCLLLALALLMIQPAAIPLAVQLDVLALRHGCCATALRLAAGASGAVCEGLKAEGMGGQGSVRWAIAAGQTRPRWRQRRRLWLPAQLQAASNLPGQPAGRSLTVGALWGRCSRKPARAGGGGVPAWPRGACQILCVRCFAHRAAAGRGRGCVSAAARRRCPVLSLQPLPHAWVGWACCGKGMRGLAGPL